MQPPDPLANDSGVQHLIRAIIHQAVADIRTWEAKCHRAVFIRSTLVMPQTTARDALEWILGERVDPLRLSFQQCCSGLDIEDWQGMGDKIIDGFDREAIDLLDVEARRLDDWRWAVSSRPVIFKEKIRNRAGVAPVPVSA